MDGEGRASWGKSREVQTRRLHVEAGRPSSEGRCGPTRGRESPASPTRRVPGWHLAWLSRGSRSPTRPRSARGGCHLPASWASPEPLGSSALGTHSGESFRASKCGFWLLRKLPPRPCSVPWTISALPAGRGPAPISLSAARRTKVWRDLTFKLIPPTSLPIVWAPCPGSGKEILGFSWACCARDADTLWIFRCGGARREHEAEGGAETHPWAGLAAGTAGGEAGLLQPAPPSRAPRCGPAAAGWLCWAVSLSGSCY